jgi:hypothetical protein
LHCDAPRPVRCAHAHTREGRVGQMWYAELGAHGGRIRMRRTVDFIHHRAPVSIGNARVGNNARRIMQRPVSLTRFSPVPLFMLQSLQSSPCLPPPLQVVGGKDGALRSTARPDKTHRRGQACWCGAAVGSLGLKGFTAFTDEAVRAVSSLAALTSSYGGAPNLRTRGVIIARSARTAPRSLKEVHSLVQHAGLSRQLAVSSPSIYMPNCCEVRRAADVVGAV